MPLGDPWVSTVIRDSVDNNSTGISMVPRISLKIYVRKKQESVDPGQAEQVRLFQRELDILVSSY